MTPTERATCPYCESPVPMEEPDLPTSTLLLGAAALGSLGGATGAMTILLPGVL